TRPLSMMEYADIELSDRPEDQYDDTVSPPLFLLITLLLSQGLSAAFPTPVGASAAEIEALTRSTSNLLIARGVIFGVFPMAMAVALLKRKGMHLTRSTLRPPFFSQCYVAAPFVMLIGLSVDFIAVPGDTGTMAAGLIFAAALIWYGQAQIRWFRQDLGLGLGKASGLFLITFVLATISSLAAAVVVATQLPRWNG
ncbi:MAG: permease, partial [Pseudomonadota bacterium]|nr:permease [Pseudomonadota bacterium]